MPAQTERVTMYTPEQMRKDAAELRDFPKWKSASEKLEQGADAVERVKVLEDAIKNAGLYPLKPACGDPVVLVFLSTAPPEINGG